MSFWAKLRGTAEAIFSIGLGGPNVKNNSGVIEARNATDAGFVVVRGAPAVAANDHVTLAQLAPAWTAVAAGATVAAVSLACYAVDCTGAQVTFNLSATPNDGDTVLIQLVGTSITNTVLLVAGGATFVEDPLTGAFSAAGGTVEGAVAGSTIALKYQSTGTRWVVLYYTASPVAQNALWNRTTWHIDFANSSGVASNANSGVDAAHPLLSVEGLFLKWGGRQPRISVSLVTITIDSGQPDDTDPLDDFEPILLPVTAGGTTAARVWITGAFTVSQTKSLTVVASMNQTTNTELQANIGGLTTLTAGTLVHNTTRDSYAWIIRRSGTTYFMTQPGSIAGGGLPVANGNSMIQFTADNGWTTGDSLDVLAAPLSIVIGRIRPVVVGAAGAGNVQVSNLTIADPQPGTTADKLEHYQYVGYYQCLIHRCVYADLQATGTFDEAPMVNCYGDGGYLGGQRSTTYGTIGGVAALVAGFWGIVSGRTSAPGLGFSGVYFLNNVVVRLQSGVASFFGYNFCAELNLESTMVGTGGATLDLTTEGPSPPGFGSTAVWGAGTLDAGGGKIQFIPGAAVSTFPLTGGLQINRGVRAFASNAAQPVVSNGNLPVTPANLDAGFVTSALTGTNFHLTLNGSNVTATGSKFLTELYPGAVVTFSTQPGAYYRVLTIASDTSFNMSRTYSNPNTTTATGSLAAFGNSGLTALTGGSTFNVTSGSTAVSATLSLFTTELSKGRSIFFSAQPNVPYEVSSVTDDTHLVLKQAYSGTTSAVSSAQGVTFGGRAFSPGGGSITYDST